MSARKVYFDKITNVSFLTIKEHFEEFKKNKSSITNIKDIEREFNSYYLRHIRKTKTH